MWVDAADFDASQESTKALQAVKGVNYIRLHSRQAHRRVVSRDHPFQGREVQLELYHEQLHLEKTAKLCTRSAKDAVTKVYKTGLMITAEVTEKTLEHRHAAMTP